MPIRDDLPSLYAFHRWADETVIEAVRGLPAGDYTREPAPGWASVRATLVHLFDATSIWSRRLDGLAVTSRRTEDDLPTLDDAERLMREGHDAFDRLVSAVSPEQLASTFTYRNFQGVTHRTPLWAVYRHVVNHGTYHRGQVASKLKRFGVEPPSTDLVFWAAAQTAPS